MGKKKININLKQLFSKNTGTVESRKSGRDFAEKAKKSIEKGFQKFGNEAAETRVMADSFFRLLEAKLHLNERTLPPTEDEIREAIEQLKDVGRFSVFTTAVILPGGAVSLMGLEMLARKFGIKFTFIPSAFRKNAEWKYPDGQKKVPGKKIDRRKKKSTIVKPVEEKTKN